MLNPEDSGIHEEAEDMSLVTRAWPRDISYCEQYVGLGSVMVSSGRRVITQNTETLVLRMKLLIRKETCRSGGERRVSACISIDRAD